MGKDRCAAVIDLMSSLISLGGASLQGHRIGEVPCRTAHVANISSLASDYCQRLGETAWRMDDLQRLKRVSEALATVLVADRDRHLVLEVEAGRQIPELVTLSDALSDVLKHRPIVTRRTDTKHARWWLEEKLATIERHRKWIRDCL